MKELLWNFAGIIGSGLGVYCILFVIVRIFIREPEQSLAIIKKDWRSLLLIEITGVCVAVVGIYVLYTLKN